MPTWGPCTAPRRNRCWVLLLQPAGKPLGTRDLLPCSATSVSVSYTSTSPGSLDSSVRPVEVTATQTQLMPSHYHLIISSHLVPAHVGSSHCPNTDNHASFVASASNRPDAPYNAHLRLPYLTYLTPISLA